jgi:hypothetical protein
MRISHRWALFPAHQMKQEEEGSPGKVISVYSSQGGCGTGAAHQIHRTLGAASRDGRLLQEEAG